MKKIDELRKDTYLDLVDKLNKYGRCALVRPTGFGKTGILTKLLKGYENVVFLYPSEVVVDAVLNFYGSNYLPNVIFMSYSKLIKLSISDMKSLGEVDLIICDECHRLGAPKTCIAMRKLLKVHYKAKLVGATATPNRMDLVDEIEIFFSNIVTKQYTLHDAFEDGVLKKPYYCFCSYGVEDLAYVEKETRFEIDKCNEGKEDALVLLRSRLIEISNLQRMDVIIKDTCICHLPNTTYMKFIVFFSSFSHMDDKGKDIYSWFSDAFPAHKVNILKVSSETKEYTENLKLLGNLKFRDKTIDLIFCVDMLNMGYHIDDLTGIIMYRGTESGIIYSQQLGRALSTGSNVSSVVIDIVDNIHRETMYAVLEDEDKPDKKQACMSNLLKKYKSGEISKHEFIELEELVNSSSYINGWWRNANRLTPEDLISTGHEATYRELIAKTVAEPISMRCRQAWSRWKERGGDSSVMKKDYILNQLPPENVPLEPFCRLKKVSVNAVLKEMGL